MKKKIFIVTGEPSGDLHAACVVEELKKLLPDVVIEGIGGENLLQQGVKLLHDHSDMAVLGLDSFKKIPEHIMLGKKIINYLKNELKPDLVLLIDYGGFNLRLAEHLKKNDFKVFYYIAPQVWASRKGRLKKIAAYIDKMLLILPFEEEIHRNAGVNAEYVGHPLISQIPSPISKTTFCEKYSLDPDKPVVGLFPGSRRIEIHFLIEIFLNAAILIKQKIPDAQFCLAQSTNISDSYLAKYMSKVKKNKDLNLKILKNANYEILSAADFLILASGTVTLEAAIYQTPMLISYKTYLLAYWIYLLIRYLDCIGLPNIILRKKVIPEYLQMDARPELIANAVIKLLTDPIEKEKMLKDLVNLKEVLTDKKASERVAQIIYKEISSSN